MKTFFIFLFLLVSSIVLGQGTDPADISIYPNQNKNKQYVLISSNGKRILSNTKAPHDGYEVKGKFKSVLLTDLVDAIKVQVREEISDSLATVEVGGSSDSAYYAIIQQSGSSNPTEAMVFQNDFGTATWEYDVTGTNLLSFSGLPSLQDTSFFVTIAIIGAAVPGDKIMVDVDESGDKFIFTSWNSANPEALADTWDMYLSITKKD